MLQSSLRPCCRFTSAPNGDSIRPNSSVPANSSPPSTLPIVPAPMLWDSVRTHGPGLAFAFGLMLCGFEAADHLGMALMHAQGIEGVTKSPISGIPVSIVAGMVLGNLVLARPNESLKNFRALLAPGLAFSGKKVLQLGVICIGAKLSFTEILSIGAFSFPAVVIAVTGGLLASLALSRRIGLPRRLGLLIGAGSSICGVTAILALAPSIKATNEESAAAVACVVTFGTVAMLSYPYLAHALLATPQQVGLFLGLAIHDTSQVLGAAVTYSEVYSDKAALHVATITKMTRNIFLGLVIPYLSALHAKEQLALIEKEGGNATLIASNSRSTLSLSELRKYIPGFIYGFLAMSLVRSVGDMTLLSHGNALLLFNAEQWHACIRFVSDTVGLSLLGTAMTSVGLTTSWKVLRGVGVSAFFVGLVSALAMGCIGFSLALLVGLALKQQNENIA